MRVVTGLGFEWPVVVTQVLVFVPEPGTLFLVASAAIGLAVAGRSRIRR